MKRRRRPGRVRKGSGHLSISATDAEWERCREKAKRRGLPMARYVIELVERDGAARQSLTALSPGEQRELLEGVREIRTMLSRERDPAERRGAPAGEVAAPPAPDDAGEAGTATGPEENVEDPPAPDDGGPDEPAADDGKPVQPSLPL